ncbi:hypothetical protein Ddye_028642 [Dipteronia dyeriana]|uniref:Uncharacterized protein n=1 Tax=Dipteronia dyeriana TaxID=168575 RepID=A0AAD9TDQ4_9ROSI|nr:hypothetical protein Ddye_028642 [Dipteronia dyeriana]
MNMWIRLLFFKMFWIHLKIVSTSEWLLLFLRLVGTTLTEDLPGGNFDRFLTHFQRYILSKGVLPLDVEFDLQAHSDKQPDAEKLSGRTTANDDVDERGGPASDEDDEVHFRQQLAEVDPEEVPNFDLA